MAKVPLRDMPRGCDKRPPTTLLSTHKTQAFADTDDELDLLTNDASNNSICIGRSFRTTGADSLYFYSTPRAQFAATTNNKTDEQSL